LNVKQAKIFARQKKKLHGNQISELDLVIKSLMLKPDLGELKKGDLNDVRVYKFKMVKQLFLLAYQFDGSTMTLLNLGVHENFYKNLKKYRKNS